MKNLLLFLLVMASGIVVAQRIDENKVIFSYMQLPEHPIDNQHKTFQVVTEPKYEQANEDSLMSYQIKLEAATAQYESELAAWREKKKVLQRQHLTALANWEKSNNASGAVAPRPAAPTYPPQPVMTEVRTPILHSDILEEKVKNAISLEGFERGENGVSIVVGVLPLSDINISFKKVGTGAATKYNYSSTYKLPLEVKVETPTQGTVLHSIVLNTLQTYKMETYASQYEFELWWMDNEATFYKQLEDKARKQALIELNALVNNKCGYPVVQRTAEVYTVKKHKGHSYKDLTRAYTLASQGYSKVSQKKDRSAAKPKLNEAISIWKKMLEESDMNDNKARVNDKVTGLLYCNIAEAYIWMGEFDQAELYINQAVNAGNLKFKWAAEQLRPLLQEKKTRWNTNF